jgi:hypothetical protein
MLIDLTEIGWYLEGPDGEPRGPFSKRSILELAEHGAVDANSLVRHSTKNEWVTIGEMPPLAQALPAEREAGAGAPLVALESVLPAGKGARLDMAKAEVTCWRHGGRQAVHVCQRCHRPVCERCVDLKRRHVFCRKCQAHLHNWRVLAGMVDFWLIPTVLQMVLFGIIGGVAATQTGPGPQWVGLLAMGGSWAVSLVLITYYLLKDGFFSGRSIGKVASGVQAIDVASGRPIGVGKSALRNLIFQVPVLVILPLQVLFALGRPGVVGPGTTAFMTALIMVMGILNLGIFLFELALMYRAPLMRRLGDRIGGTRVVDYGKRLEGRRRRWQAKWAKTLGRVQGLAPGEALEVTLPGA